MLTFGLVTVPVQMLTATEDHTVHFHQLQRGTSDRVRYQRVNERTGAERRADPGVQRHGTGGANGQEGNGPEAGGEGRGQDDLAPAGEYIHHGRRSGGGEARVAAVERVGAVSAGQ